jgi:transcriptional regulator with XRE-family HTH domain
MTYNRRRPPRTDLGCALRIRFARNVRSLRHAKGLTQAELAEAAGLGRPFLSRIENGHFSVTLETLGALAQALGTGPSTLLAK